MAAKKARGIAKPRKNTPTPRLTTRERLEKAIFGTSPSPVPQFSPDGPPIDWEAQHGMPRGVHNRKSGAQWFRGAKPVPRQASAHFYGVDTNPHNFYFY